MKIIVWDLPEKQIAYIKANCKDQFEAGEICVVEPGAAGMLHDQLATGEILAKDLLIISQSSQVLAEAVKAGMATLAYQERGAWSAKKPGCGGKEPDVSASLEPAFSDELDSADSRLPAVDMVAEGFEEIDFTFLEHVYERHHKIPWTILETERLLVRELSLDDMDALFELYSYEGMTDYMEGLYPYEEECAYQKAYIENMYRFFGYGMWLVFEKESGKLVGRAGVEHREELQGELELGYAIGTPWQGQGYGTEVCVGIINYVHEELGFEEICSLVQPENIASVQLLRKLGFHEAEELVLEGIRYKKFEKSL